MTKSRYLSLGLCILTVAFSLAASAATFTVTETSDNDCSDNDCALQAALTEAQDNDESDTINIAAGTYDASGGEFSYLADATAMSEENFALTIEGAGVGQTIIDGGTVERGLSILTDALSDDSAANVTVRGIGFVNGNGFNNGGNLQIETTKANITVERCRFSAGVATNNGGGLWLRSDTGVLMISDNEFDGNHSNNNGGAMQAFFDAEVSLTLVNNVAHGNSAGNNGGAVSYFSLTSMGSPFTFVHNTIFDNSANNYGGGLQIFSENDGDDVNIYNNIIWGNTATTDGDDISHFHSDADANNVGNTVNLSHNVFSQFFHDCNGGACTETLSETGNLDVDPLFVNSGSGDLHLQSGSPLIDQGDPAAPALPGEDIDGDPRTLGNAPDIGADETTACGDGSINGSAGEACDDGNGADGDGCDGSCQVETGFSCTGEPSMCTVPSQPPPANGANNGGGCSLIR